MLNIPKYNLEFILHTRSGTIEAIKSSLSEFGDELHIVPCDAQGESGNNFKINMKAEDPTLIFDICAQLGRIKSVKAEEGG